MDNKISELPKKLSKIEEFLKKYRDYPVESALTDSVQEDLALFIHLIAQDAVNFENEAIKAHLFVSISAILAGKEPPEKGV